MNGLDLLLQTHGMNGLELLFVSWYFVIVTMIRCLIVSMRSPQSHVFWEEFDLRLSPDMFREYTYVGNFDPDMQ